MKKGILIIFVMFLHYNIKSQVWIDSGAVWHYDYWNVGEGGFLKYAYTQDTITGGKNCQMITGELHRFVHDQFGNIVYAGHFDLENEFTYVSGDTVFYFNNGEFFILYNFGAAIGDKWIISTSNPGYQCDDTSRIEVTDVGTININATDYRYITVRPTSNSPLGFQGTYVERFGNINTGSSSFQSLFPDFYQCDSLTGIYEWSFYNFKCFEDKTFNLYNPSSEDCEYLLTHLGINETSKNDFLFYPNPASKTLTVNNNLQGTFSVQIYNYQGALLRTFQNSENFKTIDISELKSGIYLLNFKSEHYGNITKIIIKE